MQLDEQALAVTRFLVFVALIAILLRARRSARVVLGMLFLGLVVYVGAALTVREPFDDCFGCADMNAMYSAPATDPRLYEPLHFVPRAHETDMWGGPFTVRSSINAPMAHPLAEAGYLVPQVALTRAPSHAVRIDKADREHPRRRLTATVSPERHTVRFSTGRHLRHPRSPGSPGSPGRDIGPSPSPSPSPSAVPRGAVGTVDYTETLPGDINEACGWEPSKLLLYGNPSNRPMSAREYDPQMAEYNTRTRTGIIQPGVYTRTEIQEPQITNSGISFVQQFAPVSETVAVDGSVMFTQHDPRLAGGQPKAHQHDHNQQNLSAADVFDPRTAGYGDDRRAYLEPVTGQVRYYYDDIDQHRADPMLGRSHVPMADAFAGNPLNTLRYHADASFIESTNRHRLDIQERLMRKSNEITRQRRVAPIRR